ncbi:hypothetical protein NHP190002_14030 [Helicobacter ailurogastricus]|uniref:Uncharacterized protein n=1 Tax=Helicobacter ailurogastricus TaxID=1578720 RepID=A0A0K2X6H9_9HELI|nr:hypothetical protein NHP190002_14030 [Helicobacter ailurogastricus]CRF41193.1 hypothetical protein HAL011_09800 [Helicobacter ailurogastricus]CRF41898.1 hypothetical protein HAL013_00450 [Helicobacter ailurogastricus]CRF43741.1 hypothetical protein HAL09_02910 [Helicobacter ailurogastricus]
MYWYDNNKAQEIWGYIQTPLDMQNNNLICVTNEQKKLHSNFLYQTPKVF